MKNKINRNVVRSKPVGFIRFEFKQLNFNELQFFNFLNQF
jgi:hypothetical protein